MLQTDRAPYTLVVDGHPSPDSLTAALARHYAQAHGDARVLALRDLEFDVHLRHGYRRRTELEPDLVQAKRMLHAAGRISVFSPVWWGSTPALLKGFFDRALLPHQEYRYRDNGLPEGLLAGRTGRVTLTCDTPRWATLLTGTPALGSVRRNVLGLCGIKRVRSRRLTGARGADAARIARWFELVADDARRDARDDARVEARGRRPVSRFPELELEPA